MHGLTQSTAAWQLPRLATLTNKHNNFTTRISSRPGIMLWELATGGRAFVGMPRALIGHQVFFFCGCVCDSLRVAYQMEPSGQMEA